MKVAIVHPDLGIGGAERLIVDAALGLQSRGHDLEIFTSHHDEAHCFQETKNGSLKVTVWGDFLPRSFFGRFQILFAILRNIYLSIRLVLLHRHYDVIISDQISVSIPILKLTHAKILFYCHFPDQLLSPRNSLLKKIYRWPFDTLEEITTGMADEILVNSAFTRQVFSSTFKRLNARGVQPKVLYPSINFGKYAVNLLSEEESKKRCQGDLNIISINRFERKKNIGLAIQALAHLRDASMVPSEVFSRIHLTIAGGYDERVAENREHLSELKALAMDCGFTQDKVSFKPSFSEDERTAMLRDCLFLVYTPTGEHFGIVPVEAMYSGRAVVAVNDAGPKETVISGHTGILCDPSPASFASAFAKLLNDPISTIALGKNGHRHTKDRFSLESFSKSLEEHLVRMIQPCTSTASTKRR